MQTVAELMTRDLITARRETSVRELAEIFTTRGISSIPVVDDAGTLQGVVTETDLVERDRNLHIPTVINIFDWFIYLESDRKLEKELKKVAAQTAGELMSEEVLTVAPSDSVANAADIMAENRVGALPVVENGKLVGIIARIDLIRSMVK